MRRTFLSLFIIAATTFFSCDGQTPVEPIHTDSIPKTVEDSATQIIDRANKHLEDSGRVAVDSSKSDVNH